MLTFVTLFDQNYLSRGLALYSSLKERSTEDFCLYILCMDDDVKHYFSVNIFDNIKIISLSDIEDYYPVLKKIKTERTSGEYCWTLSPFSIQYVIKKYNTDHCTYIDADIYFFDSPVLIYDAIPKDKSVLITSHNYSVKYNQDLSSGRYCVQFVFFRNDLNGNTVLEWWRQQCENWCYNRHEDGKFGDQKYLDDWTSRFNGVYVCQQFGAGLAPWNVQQVNVFKDEYQKLQIQDVCTKDIQPIIFYHFHQLKFVKNAEWHLGEYDVQAEVKHLLYEPYAKLLSHIESELDEIYRNKIVLKREEISTLRKVARVLKRTLKCFVKEWHNVFSDVEYKASCFRISR